MTDSATGTWAYTYDGMNRLTSGTATGGQDVGLLITWQYDRYGNRWDQTASTAPGYNPPSGNVSAVQPQLTFTGNTNRIDGWSYDAVGNLRNDQIHAYTYDAENRIATIGGAPAYIYDAEGRRVAKTNSSGVATSVYVLGLGGEQVSELNSSGAWVHSNVFAAGGRLLATYEGPAGPKPNSYHFHLTDWLGTQRMQTTASGNQEEVCYSYPFGDGLSCTGGSDATEHHFTGKERDTESGLDYFMARYMTSDLGRFMTPDFADTPTAVPYAMLGDPQSLNLYMYVNNNPIMGIDADGHCGLRNDGCQGPTSGLYVGALSGGPMGDPSFGIVGPNGANGELAEGEARVEGLWGQSGSSKPKGHLSKRDKAYLNKYYKAVASKAAAYGVDAALVLGLGIESGFASKGTYLRTGDAFGMTGGNTTHMTSASSPEENVDELFSGFGKEMQGTGSNIPIFLDHLEKEDDNGNQITSQGMYNSVEIPPTAWKSFITGGIKQMQRDIPIYLSQ